MTYIAPKRRKESATVHVDGKDKFPVDSEHTAESALKELNRAKPPLTSGQKSAVRRKAAKFGVTSKKKEKS